MPISSAMAGGSRVSGGGGGSKADILLTISLLAKGIKEAEKVRKELQGLSKETKASGQASAESSKGVSNFASSLTTLSNVAMGTIGAIGAVAGAIQTVLDVGQSGAGYSQMQESFKSLNAAVAPNIDLPDQLGEASLGTSSKFELMNAASVALAGLTGEFGEEMANALPRLLEIAKASEKMNPALGDTGFLFQSLTIGLKRLSPRLIDNTGLQIRLSEAYKKLADQRGKSTQELTSEEQQLALLNATLEAGQVLIQQAGGNVVSMTDAYTQFGASVEDTKNAFKAFFDEAIGRKVVTGLNALFFGIQGINDQYDNIVKSAEGAATSIRDLGAEYDAYIIKSAMVAHATGEITDAQRDMLVEFASVDPSVEGYDKISESAKDLIKDLGLVTEETYRLNNALTEADQVTAYGDYQKSILQAATVTRKLSTDTAKLIEEFNKAGTVSKELQIQYGQQVHTLSDAGKLMPIKETGDFEKALIQLMHSLDMMTFSEYQAVMAGKALEGEMSEGARFVQAFGKELDGTGKKMDEQKTSILSLTAALKLAKTDGEKVRIATELFGVALDDTSMAAYRQEEAMLINRLAIEQLTESDREAIETELALVRAKISAGEASQDLAEEEQELAEETRKLADEARNAKTAFQTMFEGLDRGFESDIANFKKDIEFLQSGGAKVQDQWELVELLTQRELMPLDEVVNLSNQLYLQAIKVKQASGEMGQYEAATALVSELSLGYDQAAASAYSLIEFEKLKNEAIEDGLELTQERLDKLQAEADMTGAIQAEYDAAYEALAKAGEFDFSEALLGALDPSIFTESFANLPDQLQQLFVEAFSGMGEGFEVEIVPTVPPENMGYLEDIGVDTEIPMEAILSVAAEGEEKQMLDWFLSGASAEQIATIAANFSPELTPEMQVLIGGEGVTQTASLSVTHDADETVMQLTGDNVTQTANLSVTHDADDTVTQLVSGESVSTTISTSVTDDTSEHVKELVLNSPINSSVSISVTDDTSKVVQELVTEDTIDSNINVSVTDNISNDLSRLILNDTLERTIRVTVVTEGDVPGKATGGRIQRGEVYQVGEIRPELFVSDTAGRMLPTTGNPYSGATTMTPAPIYVNINNPSISNDLDLEMLSYQIARRISDRQRGIM